MDFEVARDFWRRATLVLWFISLAFLPRISAIAAQSVSLAWDPSADTNAVGYMIYYGNRPHSYTNTVSVGTATTTMISGLIDGATYYFSATAYDSLGNQSDFSNEVSYSVPKSPPPGTAVVTLQTNGSGGISPNLASQNLTIGKTYTMTAIPASGQVFAGWSGSANSPNATLTFLMASNLVFQANFIPSPFIPVSGTYNGLFSENSGPQLRSSGSFSLQVTTRGTYSGRLQLGASKYTFSGLLNVSNQASNSVPRSKGSTPLSLTFALGDDNTVTGQLTDNSWTASLGGYRAVFNSKTNPAPSVGSYTMEIPGGDGSDGSPAGNGFGMVRASSSGTISLGGILADGTKLTQSSLVSDQGFWPVYVSLYKGQGFAMGWLGFTNDVNSDLAGSLFWIKGSNALAHYYPGGFTHQSAAAGALYTAPVGSNIVDFTTANVGFAGGNLSSEFTNAITLGPNSKVTSTEGNLTMSFSLPTGLFRGKVIDPSSGKPFLFSGAVIQKMNAGYGFLLGTNLSSAVSFGP